MLLNQPNLINWYSTAYGAEYPRPFWASDCRSASIVTYPGDTTVFFLNVRNSVSVPPEDYTISLQPVRPGAIIPVIYKGSDTYTISATQKALYGYMQTPVVAPGLYRWVLLFNTTGEVYCRSGLVEVMTEAECKAKAVRVDFHNPTTLLGSYYPWVDFSSLGLPPDAQNMPGCWVKMVATNPQLATEVNSYQSVTTGQRMLYNPRFEQVHSFQTALSDADLLKGLSAALIHKTVLFNGKAVSLKENLSYQFGKSPLTRANFSVYDNSDAQPLL